MFQESEIARQTNSRVQARFASTRVCIAMAWITVVRVRTRFRVKVRDFIF